MQVPSHESHLARHVLVRVIGEAERFIQVVHGAVKRVHELVLEVLCIRQVPPPPALLQAAAVACIKNSIEKLHNFIMPEMRACLAQNVSEWLLWRILCQRQCHAAVYLPL